MVFLYKSISSFCVAIRELCFLFSNSRAAIFSSSCLRVEADVTETVAAAATAGVVEDDVVDAGCSVATGATGSSGNCGSSRGSSAGLVAVDVETVAEAGVVAAGAGAATGSALVDGVAATTTAAAVTAAAAATGATAAGVVEAVVAFEAGAGVGVGAGAGAGVGAGVEVVVEAATATGGGAGLDGLTGTDRGLTSTGGELEVGADEVEE